MHCAKGFTLIEIIIVISITALIVLALGEFIIQGYKTYNLASNQITQVSTARRIQDNLVRELREAIAGDDGAYPIITAEANRLEFYSDIDSDSARERVEYWRDEAVLYRTRTEPTGSPPTYPSADDETRTLAKHLTGTASLFRYYDSAELELVAPIDVTQIATIGITFTVVVSPGPSPASTTITTRVKPRNL